MTTERHVDSVALSPRGPQVSRLVAGLWRLRQWRRSTTEILDFVKECVDLGITTFDHADIYGDYVCEGRFGDALALDGTLREQIQLVTKCGITLFSPHGPAKRLKHYDSSYEHILESVDRSLHALRSDHIDLLLIHRPDPLLDADKVAEAFALLRRQGKVLSFGVSNFSPSQFELLASRVENEPLVTNQVEISVLRADALFDGCLDQCQRFRIAPMAWSPLGGGALFSGAEERVVRVREKLAVIGEELGGAGVDQVALAWLLHHPVGIVPILGSGSIDRVRSAVGSLDLELDREQWFDILRAMRGAEVP